MAACIAPDADAGGAGTTAYLKDIAALQTTYLVAFYATQNSWSKNNGWFNPQNNADAHGSWQTAYGWSVMCYHAVHAGGRQRIHHDAEPESMAAHHTSGRRMVTSGHGASYYEVGSTVSNKNRSAIYIFVPRMGAMERQFKSRMGQRHPTFHLGFAKFHSGKWGRTDVLGVVCARRI